MPQMHFYRTCSREKTTSHPRFKLREIASGLFMGSKNDHLCSDQLLLKFLFSQTVFFSKYALSPLKPLAKKNKQIKASKKPTHTIDIHYE